MWNKLGGEGKCCRVFPVCAGDTLLSEEKMTDVYLSEEGSWDDRVHRDQQWFFALLLQYQYKSFLSRHRPARDQKGLIQTCNLYINLHHFGDLSTNDITTPGS